MVMESVYLGGVLIETRGGLLDREMEIFVLTC